VVADLSAHVAGLLRTLAPELFFTFMARRAKKQRAAMAQQPEA
jgi:hypothetical protein